MHIHAGQEQDCAPAMASLACEAQPPGSGQGRVGLAAGSVCSGALFQWGEGAGGKWCDLAAGRVHSRALMGWRKERGSRGCDLAAGRVHSHVVQSFVVGETRKNRGVF
eukprot:1155392-Pelagomonas_calceolata.AAC.2